MINSDSRDLTALVESLAADRKVITFYDVVYNYLLCPYMVFLDQVVPEEERAPLPASLIERFAAGNRFERKSIGELIWAQTQAGKPVSFPAGEFRYLVNEDPVEAVRLAFKSAPTFRSFGLVVDGVFHSLPDDGRKRNPLVQRLASEASQILLVAYDDFHSIEDDAARRAHKDQVSSDTVAALAAGVAAMKAGSPAPLIIGPRLPRVYVKELDANLIGEPDLLVPVPSALTYTAVDYKDASVLESSTRVEEWHLSPATDPFFESGVASDELGAGVLQKKQRLQLFHYYLMLGPLMEALGTEATPWAAIIGRQGVAVWSDLTAGVYGRSKRNRKSPADIYLEAVPASEEVAELGRLFSSGVDIELPAQLGPAKNAACAECPFRRHCEEERRRNGGHLTLHPDMGVEKALNLGDVLATPSLEGLAYEDPAELTRKIIDGEVKGFGKLPEEIHPRVSYLVDGARAILKNKVYRRRDQSRVPTLEAVVEVHLDLENNNNPMADGKVAANHWFQTGYVTKKGLDKVSDKVTTRYTCRFTDGTPEAEADMLRAFWASMHRLRSEAKEMYEAIVVEQGELAFERLQMKGEEAVEAAFNRLGIDSLEKLKEALGREALSGIVPFRIFVYSPAEFRIMRAKAAEHADFPGVPSVEDVEALFQLATPGRPESAVAVDLCAFVETYLHLPLPDRRLKTVAPYVGHYWDVDDPNGLAATYKAEVMFTNPGSEEAEESREWLWLYNKADCMANLEVRRWIDSTPFKGVEQLDAEGIFRTRFPRRAARRVKDLTLFDLVQSA